MKNKLLLTFAVLALTLPNASSQVVIEDFSNLAAEAPTFEFSWRGGSPEADQFVQNSGFISITPVNGGNPRDDGQFSVAFAAPIDLTGFTSLATTARIDSGNLAPGFNVSLVDDMLNTAAATYTTAGFTMDSFTTQTAPLVFSAFDFSSVIGYTISGGNPLGENAFRVSFDQVTAVPEPSVAAFLSLGSLALFLARRRSRS